MARETISVNNNHETLKNEFRRVFPNMDFGDIKKIVMRGDMLKIKTTNNAVVRFTGVDKKQILGWIDGTKAKDTEIQDVWKNLMDSFGRNSKVPGAYMNEVNANLLNVAHQVGNVMNETLNHANNLSHDVVSNVLKYSDGTHYYQSRAGQYTIHKKTDVTGNPVMTVVHPNGGQSLYVLNGNGGFNVTNNLPSNSYWYVHNVARNQQVSGNNNPNSLGNSTTQPQSVNNDIDNNVPAVQANQPIETNQQNIDKTPQGDSAVESVGGEQLKKPEGGVQTKLESKYETIPKVFDSAVPYNYQSIWKLDQTKLKDPSTMSTRAIIRMLFQGNIENFVDIIEVGGSKNSLTKPGSLEKQLLREFFKKPLKGLVLTRDIDVGDVWNALDAIVTQNPQALHGFDGVKANEEFFLQHGVNLSAKQTGWLNRLFKSDKQLIARHMAKLASLYVEYQKGGSSLGAYTNRLLGMLENMNGVQKYMFETDSLRDMIKANQDNVGELAGVSLLDAHKATTKEAYVTLAKLAQGGKEFPSFLDAKEIDAKAAQALLQVYLAGGEIPSHDTRIHTLFKNYPGLKALTQPSAKGTPAMMLIEAKALGVAPGVIANIKEIAEKATLNTEQYGQISPATILMNFIVDYNANGKGGDAADFGKFSGAQLLTNYRLAVNEVMIANNLPEEKSSEAEAQVMQSVLNAVKSYALAQGDTYFAHILNTAQSWDVMIKEHPAIVRYIQNYMKNYAGEPRMIFSANQQGSVEQYYEEVTAGTQEFINTTLDDQLNALVGITDAQKTQLKELLVKKAKELIKDYEQQARTLSEKEKEYFSKMVSLESLQQNILHTMLAALNAQPSFGGNWAMGFGTALALTENIQLNLGTGLNRGRLIPGLGLGWNTKDKRYGANVDVNALGASASVYARLGQWENTEKMSATLEPITKKVTNLTASASAGVGLDKKLAHVGLGLHGSLEQDKKAGIDQIANNAFLATKDLLADMMNDPIGKASFDVFINKGVSGELDGYLRKMLSAKFPKTGSAILDDAVRNILGSLYQVRHEPNQDKMIDQVASSMADQWRNAQLDALSGKYELSKLGVGIGVFLSAQNLATGSVGLSLSAELSRYSRGAGAVNTAAEKRLQQQSQYFGIDNRSLKMNNSEFVRYLNRTMQASRGMVDKNTKSTLGQFELSQDGKFIIMPASLWRDDKNLTIKVAQGSQDKIAYDDKGNMYVSVGEAMRLSVSPDQNKAVYVLNVGALTSGPDDIVLTRHLDKNVTRFKTKEQMNDIIHRTHQVKNLHENAGVVLHNVLGPNATNFVLGSDGQTISYDLKQDDGKLEKKMLKVGDKIGNWEFVINNGALSFVDKSQSTEIQSLPLEYTFDGFGGVIEALADTTTQANIEAWENKNPTKVKNFYADVIDGRYINALNTLVAGGLWNADAEGAIKAVLNGTDNSVKEQLAIYMTQVFALEQGKNSAIKLMNLRDGKNTPAYTRINGAESGGMKIQDILTRDDFKSAYKENDVMPAHKNEWRRSNLIGYTAFYRTGKGGHRGYGMTLPGYTNVLAGKVNTFATADKGDKAKIWLLEKIKTDSFAKNAIEQSLVTKLNIPGVNSLGSDHMVKLLSGESVNLNGMTVKIDATPVFYLLAECANESIGLQINAITTTTQDGKTVTVPTDLKSEIGSGDRAVSVTNAAARQTLARQTVFRVAIGGMFGFGGDKGGGENAPGLNSGTDPKAGGEEAPGLNSGTDPKARVNGSQRK